MSIFRKSILCFTFNVALVGLCVTTLFAWSGGPPAYRTDAPGDEGTCNADGCHNSYDLNAGGATFSITAPDTYTAGDTVKIEVSFGNSSGKSHGFEMTALDANGNRVGTFKKIGKMTQVIPANDYRGCEKADKNKYIEQTSKGTKKKSWKFKWIAPDNAADPVTFYAAGSEADGNGNASNDYVYTATAEINAGL